MRVTSFPARLALSCAAAAIVVACGSERPPLLGDYGGSANGVGGGARSEGQATFDLDAGQRSETCDMGPELGVCACVDLTVLSDPPTLYFVLDRSGSMNQDNRWQNVRSVVASTVRRIGPRARFGITLFPATDSACSPGMEVMPVRNGDAPAGTYGPTTQAVISSTNLLAQGGTPTSDTMRKVFDRVKGRPGRTFVVLATDGGPNCNATASCGADRCMLNIESVMPECTPSGPTNCCAGAPQQCLDADPLIAAIASLRGAGIPTFVVGVPGSQAYASLLDRAAEVGGTARSTPPYYYRVDTSDTAALGAALTKVAAKVTATCEFPLSDVPDPTRVNVYLDDTVIPKDAANGWVLDDKTVRLVGQTCQRVLDGEALGVRVVAGCPTVATR